MSDPKSPVKVRETAEHSCDPPETAIELRETAQVQKVIFSPMYESFCHDYFKYDSSHFMIFQDSDHLDSVEQQHNPDVDQDDVSLFHFKYLKYSESL